MMQQRSKIIKLAIVGAVLLIAVIILFLLLGKPKVIKLNARYMPLKSSSSLAVAGIPNQSKIVFSNGRHLVLYDYSNGVSEQLSPDSKLPEISSIKVSPDGKKILFGTIKQTSEDILGQQLEKDSVDGGATISIPYWWIYNTETKRFEHLSRGVVAAIWDADSTGLTSLNKNGANGYLEHYEIDGSVSTPKIMFNVSGVLNFGLSNDGFYLNKINGQVVHVDSSGQNEKVVVKDVTGLEYSPTNIKWATATTKAGEPRDVSDIDILLLDLDKDKKKVLGSAGEYAGHWTDGGEAFIFSDENSEQLMGYSVQSGDKFLYQINTSPDEELKNLVVVGAFNTTSFVVKDSENIYYLVGDNNIKSPKTIESLDSTQDEFYTQYSKKSGYLLAYLKGADTAETRQKIYKVIRDKGYDPNMMSIEFYPYSTGATGNKF